MKQFWTEVHFATVLLIFFFCLSTHIKQTSHPDDDPPLRKVIFLLQNLKRNILPQQYVSNIIFNIMHFYTDAFFFIYSLLFFCRD